MKKLTSIFITTALVLGVASCGSNTNNDKAETTLNLYSSRHYDVDKGLIEKFEEETGITVNIAELKNDELIAKLSEEGANTPADMVFMNGGETISSLNDMNILKPLTIEQPENLHSSYYSDNWIGVTRRARVIAHTNERNVPEVLTYDDLLSDDLKGKVLVRSSTNKYNQALIASMLQVHGEEYTTNFVKGLVNNMARTPSGNDREQAKAVVAGEGDIAIMNSYYLHLMSISTDEAEVNVSKLVKSYDLSDVHENISFVGKISDNENVDLFTEFLLSEESQKAFVEQNGEYPVNKNVELSGYIASLPKYEYQEIDFTTLGNYISDAYKIMLKNGWE